MSISKIATTIAGYIKITILYCLCAKSIASLRNQQTLEGMTAKNPN
jgi:hypothetical protein